MVYLTFLVNGDKEEAFVVDLSIEWDQVFWSNYSVPLGPATWCPGTFQYIYLCGTHTLSHWTHVNLFY